MVEHSNPNFKNEKKEHLKLLTIGSAVGSTSSAIMIDKDKVLVFGGKQVGKEYSPSNKVFLIDFSNSFKPKISELNSMKYARSDGNATILPDGTVFINGGHSYTDLEFSIFNAEIYNPNTQTTEIMDQAYFRRNYHATSLLLPDGRTVPFASCRRNHAPSTSQALKEIILKNIKIKKITSTRALGYNNR